ncbi:MAG TPA: DUF742 domain-containing protein [Pilimelia sp.]|nr:DUF742 domain-containing protein [Pilimelia sp.]
MNPPRIRPYLGSPVEVPESGPTPDPPAVVAAPRPFVLTSGRVTGAGDIDLHTQVTASVDDPAALAASAPGMAREQREIVALCAEPVSVAEISARLRLHLGVTKILVGDLREAGYLDVHLQDVDTPLDPDTILRVIDGLRAFS